MNTPEEASNPYAAPTSKAPRKRRPSNEVPSGWFYGYIGGRILLVILWVVMFSEQLEHLFIGYWTIISWLLEGVWWLVSLIWIAWLRGQWQRLPKRQRVVDYRVITPNEVAWRCLVPVYDVYWLIVVNKTLCARINLLRARHGLAQTAPIRLGIACPLTALWIHVHPVLPVSLQLNDIALLIANLIIHAIWIVYMLRIEVTLAAAMRHETDRRRSKHISATDESSA